MNTEGAKRIASRYVKALFDVTKEASAIDAVEKDMASLAQAMAENEEFRHFLTNPLLTRKAQADTLAALLAKMKAHKVTQQFMATLAHNRRLAILPEAITLFAEAVQAARGEMTAELITAGTVKPAQVEQVGKRLSKAYGRKVNLNVSRDASLLGGMVIKIGSLQIDDSMAGKLNRLEQKLKAA